MEYTWPDPEILELRTEQPVEYARLQHAVIILPWTEFLECKSLRQSSDVYYNVYGERPDDLLLKFAKCPVKRVLELRDESSIRFTKDKIVVDGGIVLMYLDG